MSQDVWNGKKIKRMKRIINKRIIQLILVILIIIVPLIIFAILEYSRLPEFNGAEDTVGLYIPRGADLNTISDSLLKKKLIGDKELFILWLTSMGKDRKLKAGYFDIPKGLNYGQLVNFLSKAQSKEINVTLIEGWNLNQISEKLSEDLKIDKYELIKLCNDSSFISSLNLDVKSLEGYLLPDTYSFYWGFDEREILMFLVKQCLQIFDDSVKMRLDSLNMNVHQILTLASIIEGEVILDKERAVVSSVYHNRLKRRIKLQADPTIQYILKGPPRRLLYDDLEIDSPYNTYRYYGLPPGPINNPGKKSIMAAIYPANTDYLYFVATGDGGHTFTRTSAEHAREKEKFNKIRKEFYRKKKYQN